MALSKKESSQIGYQAKIKWYKERKEGVKSIPMQEVPRARATDPEEYRSILKDLESKIDKMNQRIDDESAKLTIPVDKATNPELSHSIKTLDPESGGEYISYPLYTSLVTKRYSGISKIDIEELIPLSTDNDSMNSMVINSRVMSGYFEDQESIPGDNSLERYLNRYLNNMVSWNEHDYHVMQILNFADNYLGMFPDPSYVPWAMKKEVVFEKTHVKSFQDLWNSFSEIGKSESERFSGALKKLTSLKPNESIKDPTDRYIEYANEFLNGLHDLLNERFSPALICCFIKYATNLDIKTLKGLRALLQLAKLGLKLDFDDILNSFIDIINNIMRGLLLNQLIGLINQIFQRLVDPIRRWINNPEDPNWQKVFDCLPVRELIEKYIAQALDFVENFLKTIVAEKYKELEIDHIFKDKKLEFAFENKWIGRAAKLLDIIISSMELSAMCGVSNSPAGEDIKKIMEQNGLGSTEEYVYMPRVDEVPNIYNSFMTKEEYDSVLSNQDASIIPSYAKDALDAQPSDRTYFTSDPEITGDLNDCLKNIRKIDMPEAVKWD